jgi:chromosome segregation ATPase
MNEEQVDYLTKKLESAQEELSFEKSICNDLRREGSMLKEELSKITVMMQHYSDLQEEVLRTHHLNQEIQARVVTLEEELKLTRQKV